MTSSHNPDPQLPSQPCSLAINELLLTHHGQRGERREAVTLHPDNNLRAAIFCPDSQHGPLLIPKIRPNTHTSTSKAKSRPKGRNPPQCHLPPRSLGCPSLFEVAISQKSKPAIKPISALCPFRIFTNGLLAFYTKGTTFGAEVRQSDSQINRQMDRGMAGTTGWRSGCRGEENGKRDKKGKDEKSKGRTIKHDF
ncbi:hypothetical protein Q8A73_020311 [Channa argus]|nr:hypothetical protein Q8A73_020311 [Channa argus]